MSLGFAANIEELMRQAEQIDLEAARAATALLEQLHERVTAQMALYPELSTGDLGRLRTEIYRLIQEWEAQFKVTLNGHIQGADELADDVVDAQLAQAGLTVGVTAISRETLAIVQGYSADQITGVGAEARKRINTELQLAALGGRDFAELMRNIGKDLDGPSVFGSMRTRSEAIARTDVGRMYNLGWRARGNQAAGSVPGLCKKWVHATGMTTSSNSPAGVYRARPRHVRLHGTVIPWEEKFKVGGVFADGPHDPRLPAGEVINCGCRLVMDFSDIESTGGQSLAIDG